MPHDYEINELAKEESWRMFRILGEMVEGFDTLSDIGPAVTIYGSARMTSDDKLYDQTYERIRGLVRTWIAEALPPPAKVVLRI